MTMQNPLALAANTLRQVGETANQTVMSIGAQFAQVNSQILRGLATGAPPFPLPGAAGFPPVPGLNALVNGGNPGHNGNPNGNGQLGLLPGPAQLVPRQALLPLVQLETSVLPRGIPGPAGVLMQVLGAANGMREEPPAVETGIRPQERPGAAAGLEGLNGVQTGARRDVGLQLV